MGVGVAVGGTGVGVGVVVGVATTATVALIVWVLPVEDSVKVVKNVLLPTVIGYAVFVKPTSAPWIV
jgi:hypothetical protein